MNGPKILLMPLGTGGEAEERLKGALIVANRLQAHLRVLHTSISPQAIVPQEVIVMSRKALEGLHDAFDQHVGAETQRLQGLFSDACEALSVPAVEEITHPGPSASWLEAQGLRSGLVARYGKVADLIILATPPEGRPTATFEAAVLETGRPLLLVPRTLKAFPLESVMVAWNCTAEASRSLAHALPLVQQAKRVVVVTTSKSADRQPGPETVCDYLGAHGINASAEILKTGKKYKGEALLAKARDLGSDLVVMGAYSKKRLQESVFGGATQYMLANAEMPLFFSH